MIPELYQGLDNVLASLRFFWLLVMTGLLQWGQACDPHMLAPISLRVKLTSSYSSWTKLGHLTPWAITGKVKGISTRAQTRCDSLSPTAQPGPGFCEQRRAQGHSAVNPWACHTVLLLKCAQFSEDNKGERVGEGTR